MCVREIPAAAQDGSQIGLIGQEPGTLGNQLAAEG